MVCEYFQKTVKKRIYDVQFLNCNIIYHEESIKSQEIYILAQFIMSFLFILFFQVLHEI